ncbi:MAG: hypothetical protein Unbinned2365contig1001_10 [Prokaryotic dsDNA virus sp.]|nr:MAG: hypothetical protein Unbinned2365contig1001_10 [Prokaryotic dsDNA virus sp.]
MVRAWFVDFGDLGTVTETSDEITDMTGTFTAFQYDLHGTNSFEQTITSSRENGTTFFEQSISLQFSKLSKEDNAELKLMAFNRPHICLEDRNGNFMQFGLVHGCEVTGGTIVSGSAFGDLSGYTLTFTAQEAKPANFINGGTAADPYAGMGSATVTVTVGTNS